MGQAASRQRDVGSVSRHESSSLREFDEEPENRVFRGHSQPSYQAHSQLSDLGRNPAVLRLSDVISHRLTSRAPSRIFTRPDRRTVVGEPAGRRTEEDDAGNEGLSPLNRSLAGSRSGRSAISIDGINDQGDHEPPRMSSRALLRSRRLRRDRIITRSASTFDHINQLAEGGYNGSVSQPVTPPPLTFHHGHSISRFRHAIANRLNLSNSLAPTSFTSQSPPQTSEMGRSGESDFSIPQLDLAGDSPMLSSDTIGLEPESHDSRISNDQRDPVNAFDRREAPLHDQNQPHMQREQISPNEQNAHSLGRLSRDGEPPWLALLTAAVTALATQISGGQQSLSVAPTDLNQPADTIADSQAFRQILQNVFHARAAANNINGNDATPTGNSLRIFRLGLPVNTVADPEESSIETSRRSEHVAPSVERHGSRRHLQGAQAFTIVLVAIHAPSTNDISPHSEDIGEHPPRRATSNALANLPPLNETSSAAHSQHANMNSSNVRGSRFSHLRRASHHMSTSNLHWLHSRRGDHPGVRHLGSTRLATSNVLQGSVVTASEGFGDSPPGPFPPPSTPAEQNRSAVSSQPTTPSRRPSIASTMRQSTILEASVSGETPPPVDTSSPADNNSGFARHRRRSESDSVRYRNFGAGAARRNGVVEPDRVDDGDERRSRNWLVYVVGANLSQIQPTWAASSLFSDVSWQEVFQTPELTCLVDRIRRMKTC